MTKEERSLLSELAQVKLLLRRIERDASRLRNLKVTGAIDGACRQIDQAVLAVAEKVEIR